MEIITCILLFFYFIRACKNAFRPFNNELFKEVKPDIITDGSDDKLELSIQKFVKYAVVTIHTVLAMLTIAAIIYTLQ